MSTDLKTPDFSEERCQGRLRYIYACLIGVVNATLTILALIITQGTNGESLWVITAIWGVLWIFTFAAALLFWRRTYRTRLIMALLSIATVFTSYAGIVGTIELFEFQLYGFNLWAVLESLIYIHVETLFSAYVGAVILSQFFLTKQMSPQDAF